MDFDPSAASTMRLREAQMTVTVQKLTYKFQMSQPSHDYPLIDLRSVTVMRGANVALRALLVIDHHDSILSQLCVDQRIAAA